MRAKSLSIRRVNNVKDELLKKSEISLWLDSYDDIFSDFDSRPFSERALSDDFLEEAKRASRDKEFGKIELKFLMPKELRKEHDELLIKQRLKEHFKKHHAILVKERKKTITRGSLFVLAGILVMMTTAIILFKDHSDLMMSFFIILLEPAGWFLFWEGLGFIVFESKEHRTKTEFYKKMTNAEFKFLSY